MPLAANRSYTTGITCHWVMECNFNETVQVRFQCVHLDASSELRVFDGWHTNSWSSQLVYFLNFDGDRLPVASPNSSVDLTTSISGGVSSREFYSSGPVLTVRFQSGWTSEIGISPAVQRNARQHLLPWRCRAPWLPPDTPLAAPAELDLWWVLLFHFLGKAHKLIFYGFKTGGLWKMQYPELLTLAHVLKVPGPGAEGAWESHRDIRLRRGT